MLALGLVCLASSAHAACVTQRVADIPLTVWQNKLLLTVGINGSPETMALDTGAGITVISAEAAGRLNILHDFDHAAQVGGVGGADSALFIGQVDGLTVGNAQFAKLSLPIVAFPERDWQNHPLAGLLGADILANFAVDVDIAGGHLALWRETGCDNEPPPWDDNATPIAIELDPSNHIQVPLKVDGVTLNALLDTGAGGFVLTQRAGMRAGVTDDTLDSDPEIHGTGVNNRPWSGHIHRFHDVRFGPARFTNVVAALMPSRNIAQYDALIGADALVGMTLLSGTRLWISYHTKSLYILPASMPQPE
jgi:predicted aspartyl protease